MIRRLVNVSRFAKLKATSDVVIVTLKRRNCLTCNLCGFSRRYVKNVGMFTTNNTVDKNYEH